MGVRDDLENLKTTQAGVTHLVYCDVTTSMVLFASADGKLGQEDHDALAKSARAALTGDLSKLGLLTETDSESICVLVSAETGTTLFVQSPVAKEEALALRLGKKSDAVSVEHAARQTLIQIGS